MVQVTHRIPLTANDHIDLNAWLAKLEQHFGLHALESLKEILTRCDRLQQPSTLERGLWYAAILGDLMASPAALAAALVYPFYAENLLAEKQLKEQFPEEIHKIVLGAHELRTLEGLIGNKRSAHHPESLRRMMLTMVNDVRIFLVQLAVHVYLIRHSKTLQPTQANRLAKELDMIYAPLANRLGIGQLKWEIEDWIFHTLQPEAYQQLKIYLHEKRIDRETYLSDFIATIQRLLDKHHLHASVTGRVKHLYSIYKKMQKKQLQFDDLYDIRAIRILTQDVQSCYRILSLIHAEFAPIPEEFSDYIASPKANGYQSIHTIVKGPHHKLIEIQIRTHTMHEHSEMGVAAHWRYKEGTQRDPGFESHLAWLRGLLAWQEDFESSTLGKPETADDRIYVLTPQGDVFDLPKGSTPLDFAYRIHTQIGHRFRGAKVNGTMVPMTTPLETGQRVEILTRPEANPSRDWLSKPGILVSPRSRQKVQLWFREQAQQEAIEKALHSPSTQTGQPHSNQPLPGLPNLHSHLVQQDADPNHPITIKAFRPPKPEALTIGGVENLLFHMAKCCKPIHGDPVMGYITQGRGVSVHRLECSALHTLQTQAPQRLLTVVWGKEAARYAIDLLIELSDRETALKGITQLLSQQKIGLLGLVRRKKSSHSEWIQLSIELTSLEDLQDISSALRKIAGILNVTREGQL